MTRTKVMKLNREEIRQEATRQEQLRLATMKQDCALDKIDELGKRCQQQVNNRLQMLLGRTHRNVLEMKWSDFLNLKLDHFKDYKWMAPPPPPPMVRSQSISARTGRTRTPAKPQPSRTQVQSVDRAVLRRNDLPAMSFMRWPKPGEVALSKAGSPLAMQTFPDQCANVHIPTKMGVLKLQPQKLGELKRDVLNQIDSAALDEIKTLNSNLNMIVDMANKMRK